MRNISILIFAYNEEKLITKTINRIYKEAKKYYKFLEIIVLNDASKDQTELKVKQIIKKNSKIKIFNFKKNSGLTKIFTKGCQLAKYNFITWFPGDDSYLEKNLKNFFLASDNNDIVVGYRANHNILPFKRKLLSKLNNFFINLFLKIKIKDPHGTFIFRKKILKNINLKSHRYTFLIELLPLLLNKKNIKVKQIPVYLNYKTIYKSSTLSLKTIYTFINIYIKILLSKLNMKL